MTTTLRDDDRESDVERSTVADRDLTLMDITAFVLHDARFVISWMIAGFLLAVVPVLLSKPQYSATAAFAPQNNDASRSGVSAFAGQFGLSLPGSIQSQSQLYAELLRSRAILDPIVRDTFTVTEIGRRGTLVQIARITGDSPEKIAERGAEWLVNATRTSVDAQTSTLSLRVSTEYRSLSLALVQDLLRRVNEFNVKTRQSQATAERIFVEQRLALARDNLVVAEARLKSFLESNRQLGNSPELVFARDRLQRELDMRQQLANALAQSYEDASIREVRDTPVITIIDPPTVSTRRNSRNGLLRGVLGLALGAVLALVWLLTKTTLQRRVTAGDQDAIQLVSLMRRARLRVGRLFSRRSRISI
jgi:uncharacterized protein involved in exopolysaccharide biosynthesis